jgi:RimK family alpha-L-glutamate ligase
MAVGVVGHVGQGANPLLVDAWQRLGIDASLLDADAAVEGLRGGDVALIRLDVLPTLDGIEPGLERAAELAAAGVRVLNVADALLAVHDKLETARRLQVAGVPHPPTAKLARVDEPLPLAPPLVLKPRFGSWGRDVFRCESERDARRCLAEIRTRSWFERQGVLVQELLPASVRDLRLLVAGAAVVGAATREAAPGEWRTNISLGGRLLPATLSEQAAALALAAVAAVGGDFMGVDLFPDGRGGYVVLELNGAVEFDHSSSLPHRDVYADAAIALGLLDDSEL